MERMVFNSQLFGKAVKTKRSIDLGARLIDLASEVGISKTSLHRIEQGGIPSLEDFATLMKWLDRHDYNSFFYRQKKPPNKNKSCPQTKTL